MLTFVLIALLLSVLAVVVLIWPLLRVSESNSYERETQNIHYARDRLAELEQQLQSAAISPADYEELKQEIELTLAQDIDLARDAPSESQPQLKTSNAVIITLLCCLLPVAAAATYMIAGTPTAVSLDGSSAKNAANPVPSEDAGEIGGLIGALEQRLQAEPNDTQGWTILARTYQQLGQFQRSIAAYQKLLSLQPNNPDALAGLADVQALAAGGEMIGEPLENVKKALALNPDHPQSLWLAGIAAVQQGSTQEALDLWQQLLPLLAEFPQQQAELRDVIAQTQNAAGMAPTGVESQPDETPGAAVDGPILTLLVSLDPRAREGLADSDTVFVLAKAVQGPPAPLAVKRLQVKDLPARVTLSSEDAMLPQLSISNFDPVTVTARVSKSGNPIAQPGDIQAQIIETSTANAAPIELLISNPLD